MAKNANASTDPVTQEAADAEDAPRGTIDVLLGRGRTGKTTWARWAIERAQSAGRTVAVADGDRNNATLRSFYPNASSPAAGDDVTMTAWMEELAEGVINTRGRLVLDMGGGDRSFATVAERHGFNEVLPAEGVDLTAWYFLTGGRADFETLVLMEGMGFQPPRTVIVLNEGLVLVAAGLAGGLAGAAALRGAIASQLYGVGALDPHVMLIAVAVLAVVSLVACLGPARRAARISPLAALSQQ